MSEFEEIPQEARDFKAPEDFSNENEKSEKQKHWEILAAEVEGITDKLGLGIDSGIKESIVALKAYEFPTSQSCEGHLEGEHGLPYPWIEVYAPEPEGWKEDEEKQKEWRIANLKEQKKMIGLLGKFYEGRNAPLDARITFERVGAFGGFRIQSMGADTMELLSQDEIKGRYMIYKKEMDDFTAFLKKGYLS
jgi:hypothetical protein